MNIKSSYKYQIADHKLSVPIFYGIMILITILTIITMVIAYRQTGSLGILNSNGVNISTAIFLIICPAAVFSSSFGMHLQNGISRRTFYSSRCLQMITLAAFCTIADVIISIVSNLIIWGITGHQMFTNSLFEILYFMKTIPMPAVTRYAWMALFLFLLYLASNAFGYLIGVVFYRLSKAWKIIVGVGVPSIFVLILPLIDVFLTNGNIFWCIWDAIKFSMGLTNAEFYRSFLTFGAVTVLCTIIGWIITRRATIKE